MVGLRVEMRAFRLGGNIFEFWLAKRAECRGGVVMYGGRFSGGSIASNNSLERCLDFHA